MRLQIQMIALLAAGAVALAGCSRGEQSQKTETSQVTTPIALQGPKIVQEMVAAHGGLDAWRSAPTMSFTDEWEGGGGQSHFVVEQGARRAYMTVPGADVSMAWDGEKAWSMNWPTPTPVRFLALLNYYFINLAWMTQDPGVKFGEPATGTLPGDSTVYATVMMTFEPGTGDTPDDYYRLYIDPETHVLKACDYVVTYEALLDEGESSTPEHCLIYDEMTEVNGLKLPAHFTIYEAGNVYAKCTIRDHSFSEPFDEARMTMPEGAMLDESTP
ncbi:MAG TPA: hypothetical protein VFX92_12830 [Candidatus Krumholzibacteria bacterium]|nr:hypothetical protein [Candidatus Krumholzibacteria bacterium]